MRKFYIYFLVLVTGFIFANGSFCETTGNKSESSMFTGSATSPYTQIILGIADLTLAESAEYLYNKKPIDPREAIVDDIKTEMKKTRNVPTEAEKAERIAYYRDRIAHLESQAGKADYSSNDEIFEAKEEARLKLEEEMHKPTTTIEARESRLRELQTNLDSIRLARTSLQPDAESERAIRKAAASRKFGNIIVGGARLFFWLDILGRIYVYNVLEKDPGFSPAGTVLLHGAKVLVGASPAAGATVEQYLGEESQKSGQ